MNYKTLIKILALALALVSTMSFAACSKDTDSGDMSEQSAISKSDEGNTVEKNKEAEFVGSYYNWIYSDAFKNFTASIKATTLPKDLESAFSTLAEEKRISQLRKMFCSQEVVAAIQSAAEYETKKDKYTNDVVFLKKNSKGIYSITMNFMVGNEKQAKIFELMLSEGKKAVKLTCYDENGNELYIHEIASTENGFIAVNRASATGEKWSSLQLLFKAEGTGEGYCTLTSDLAECPKSIFSEAVYAGFAGKQ